MLMQYVLDRTDTGRLLLDQGEVEWLEGTQTCSVCGGNYLERGDDEEPTDEQTRCLRCRFTLRQAKWWADKKEKGTSDDERTEGERHLEAMEALVVDDQQFVDDTVGMETAHTDEAAIEALADRAHNLTEGLNCSRRESTMEKKSDRYSKASVRG